MNLFILTLAFTLALFLLDQEYKQRFELIEAKMQNQSVGIGIALNSCANKEGK